MLGLIHKWRSGERGTTTVELALVIPVFALLLFGTIDLGLTVALANVTSEAARDGARAGQVLLLQGHTTLSAADQSAIQAAASRVTTPLARIGVGGLAVSSTVQQDAGGNYYVRVVATTSYKPSAGKLLGGLGTKNVGATSTLAVACGQC